MRWALEPRISLPTGVRRRSPITISSASWDSATLVSLLYPLLDVIVLTGLIRMLVGGGSLSRSLTLVTVSVSVTRLADLLYNGLAAEGLVEEVTV